MTQLDLIEAIRLKEMGMDRAAHGYGAYDWLLQARSVALMLASKNGETNADEILRLCPRPPSVSPNATGSLFRSKEWVCIGHTKSSHPQGHAREIKRWALRHSN